MNKLKKLLCLPTVIDLGWSKIEALPVRRFQKDVQGPTWEDYHALMKKEHPIKYFIQQTLRQWFVVHVVMPFEHLKWYVRDNIVRRTHLLDLRQDSWVVGCDDYEGGYLDPRQQILYACMNSLNRFVSETNAPKHLEWLETQLIVCAEDSHERPVLVSNIELYREALTIYKWWNVDRKSDFMRLTNADNYDPKTVNRWDAFDAQEDEMLMRLVKIRQGLWN